MSEFKPQSPKQGIKETLKTVCGSLKPAIHWAIKKPGNILRVAFQMLNYAIVVLVCMALLNLSKSGFMADFRLFGKDERGNFVIGEIITDKTPPPEVKNKHLFMYDLGLKHYTIGYGRKVASIFGYDVFGTFKWTQHESSGQTLGLGITVSF